MRCIWGMFEYKQHLPTALVRRCCLLLKRSYEAVSARTQFDYIFTCDVDPIPGTARSRTDEIVFSQLATHFLFEISYPNIRCATLQMFSFYVMCSVKNLFGPSALLELNYQAKKHR